MPLAERTDTLAVFLEMMSQAVQLPHGDPVHLIITCVLPHTCQTCCVGPEYLSFQTASRVNSTRLRICDMEPRTRALLTLALRLPLGVSKVLPRAASHRR
jgi:hypothetical protein